MFLEPLPMHTLKPYNMIYLERSYKVLNQVNRLTSKIVYDAIKPFMEKPPMEKQQDKAPKEHHSSATDLFSRFTADIINANVLFIR